MKKGVFIFSMLLLGVMFAINSGCEEDPVEACEQDLFCDDTESVTACCTDGEECYFTYNNVNYPDTDQGYLDLIAALDCAETKSVSIEGENDYMVTRLQALLEEARQRSTK